MTDPIDDPRVVELAREYLSELEAGRTPDRAGYVARFPDLAAAVAECLSGVDLARAAVEALRPVSPPPPPVEPLGDFRIVREVGRGGMGVVYEAVQLSLGRRVALKVLPFASAMDDRQLRRFQTEAHAAAQLHHTNIVPVYAVGCDRGTHYYTMQLIDGWSLDAVIRDLREEQVERSADATIDLLAGSTVPAKSRPAIGLSPRDRRWFVTAARLAEQVAAALDFAHDAGVVHRDVKPANLLLDARGNVWVTDFGLAQVSAEATVTRTGDVFGTLRYSSPEQATGRRTDVDHRTDVYSLGATLYELLTLRPIFPDGERSALLNRLVNDDPLPLRAHAPAVPAELETIVLKAVAKLPADRYQTAGEFAADLRRFVDDRPILARRPTAADHVRKWLRRHPAYARAGLVVLALAAIGFAASTAVVGRAKHQTELALEAEKQRAKEAEARFQTARRLADEIIRVANEDLASDFSQVPVRQRLLETALAYYQEFIELRQGDAAAVGELEAVRARVASLLDDLAALSGAMRHALLRLPAVQDELRVAPPDRVKLNDLLTSPRPSSVMLNAGASKELTSARMARHFRKVDAEVRSLLSAEQQQRLDELALQVSGPQVFRRPEIVKALALTSADQEKLRRVELTVFARQMEAVDRQPPGADWAAAGPPGRAGDWASLSEEMVVVLSPAQQAAWRRLAGKPFDWSSLPLPFQGIGPPRPPG